MTKLSFSKVAVFSTGAVVLASLIAGSALTRVSGDDDERGRESRIRQGFANAPLPLNLNRKNRALVGLGSYLVNVAGDCNGCHTSDQANPYLPGGNPFLGEPEKIDPDKYLVGGSEFIPAHPGFHAIVSRNLRPEANGLPEGHTFAQFRQIMRTGIDLDQAHPEYGPLLQVMPWPNFRKMTDEDIRAIYEYLSALPPNPNPQP
jgi:hypothetical protein